MDELFGSTRPGGIRDRHDLHLLDQGCNPSHSILGQKLWPRDVAYAYLLCAQHVAGHVDSDLWKAQVLGVRLPQYQPGIDDADNLDHKNAVRVEDSFNEVVQVQDALRIVPDVHWHSVPESDE